EISWSWSSASQRNAQSVSASDINKLGFQSDIGLVYRLVRQSGGVGTWVDLNDPEMLLERAYTPVYGTTPVSDFLVSTTGTIAHPSLSSASRSRQLLRVLYRSAAS